MALTALVIGGAPSWAADAKAAGPVDLRIAVNDAGYALEHIDAVATVHPEHVPGWREKRERAGYRGIPWYSFTEEWRGVAIWRPEQNEALTAWVGGSSGLYAVGVALYVYRADRVILAGCPMDGAPNVYRDEDGWAQFQRYRHAWEDMLPILAGRVTSVNGWTAKLLRRP